MMKRYQIIHLGNAYDFVVKDHQTNRTYGTLQGDSESLQECLDNLVDEHEELKKQINELEQELELYKHYVEIVPIGDIT